jgi:DNA-binding PadR family transcriptional regulator
VYADRTLIPTEVIRLCALGTLTLAPMTYGELAREVRAFTGRMSGPSLDMMGTSIELLRTEGLIEADAPVKKGADQGADKNAEATLRLTPAGEAELRDLLTANLRNTLDDMSRIVFALKLRFLHVLEPAVARDQIDRLIEISEIDKARRADTKARYGAEPGHFGSWLDADIDRADDRVAWLAALKERL